MIFVKNIFTLVELEFNNEFLNFCRVTEIQCCSDIFSSYSFLAMANNFDYNQQNYWNVPPTSQFPQQQQQQQQPQDFNFEMPDQFGQEL